MKVITEKSKNNIGKRLAAIYYIALHGFGEDVGSNFDSATKIIEHIYDIAYAIGGEHLADIVIPAYVARFNEYMEKKNERKINDTINRQAAIDAIWDGINMDIYTKEVKEILEELPSAQPEIIRCKDCKWCIEHYDTRENAPYWVCKNWDGGTEADGFCHEAERRTDG